MNWKKASHSAYNGSCVEVATAEGSVLVRDSKDPDGPVLSVTPAKWRAFLRDVAAASLPASPPAA